MLKYDFDRIVPRCGTNSFKYDRMPGAGSDPSVIPMWVADMDFATPSFVCDAVRRVSSQGVLGYTCTPDYYYDAVCRWNLSRYGFKISPEQINYVPGVVAGIFLAISVFSNKGDRVLIQQPVYHPFRIVTETCGREVRVNRLKRTKDGFAMDFDRLREDVKGCRMMILCNPHNPGGVCWTEEDLRELASICSSEGVIVVSDEIHCDMTLGGRRHIPFASVSEQAAACSITLQSASKSFNMPGIVAAQAIVPNPDIRERYFSYIAGTDQDLGNVFAYDCVSACYSPEGEEWLSRMLSYVEGNIDYLCSRLAAEFPAIRPIRPKAGFLVFLDCRDLGLTQEELVDFFVSKARLCLNDGSMFGAGGEGYMRMNLACPRAVLAEAVDRIVKLKK